ncbi:MAG TPA: TetR/AcrR family transcriptional regulator [Acidimicrobiia bacterium]|nr:TetR/AcrR family transcriptional regulator [Acidimicrobiia bacterium]
MKPGEARPGGRSARTRRQVLDATVDLLAERGYEALTYEAVAERSGVHKTTVYRRWPTKAELVADAARQRSEQLVDVPDTGTLRGDLTALARSVAANIGSDLGGAMTRTLVAAAATSPSVADASRTFWSERLRLTSAIVERAVARGELPSGTDAHLVLEALIGPLYVRLLLTGEPLDRAVADQVAAAVSSGWAAPT